MENRRVLNGEGLEERQIGSQGVGENESIAAVVLGAGDVILGWDEGFAGMKVGGKRTLIIPSEAGYGARGAGEDIPPGATLIFDVELLAVE